MKLIPLTQGKFAKVDDEDYEMLNKYRWYAHDMDKFYAERQCVRGGIKRPLLMHRFILGLEFGDKRYGDHINGDSLDNRRSNLRIVSSHQNAMNKTSHKKSSSKYLGVYIRRDIIKGREYIYWSGSICVNYKNHKLGCFTYTACGELAAALAYDEAAKKYFGEYANLNFK